MNELSEFHTFACTCILAHAEVWRPDFVSMFLWFLFKTWLSVVFYIANKGIIEKFDIIFSTIGAHGKELERLVNFPIDDGRF